MFIEVTSTDRHKGDIVLSMLCAMYSAHCAVPFEVEPVEVTDAGGAMRGVPLSALRHRTCRDSLLSMLQTWPELASSLFSTGQRVAEAAWFDLAADGCTSLELGDLCLCVRGLLASQTGAELMSHSCSRCHPQCRVTFSGLCSCPRRLHLHY